MLVTLKEILQIAEEKNIAVGSFNTPNLTSLTAILSAAEELDLPVIIQFAQCHEPWIPLSVIGPVMIREAKKAKVPVCVHLDHGADYAMAEACLNSGFTSIMYDGSALPDEENIAATRAVVGLANRFGVPVEGEIGQVLQAEDLGEGQEPDFLTEPEQALRFVQETGISSVAVAVGNIHHMKKKQARLDFDRIRALRRMISIPLVIHGCSGVSDDDVRQAVSLGINKVNVATEYNIAFTDGLRDFTVRYPNEFFPMDAMEAAMDRVTGIARGRIHVLDAAGRY